MSRICSFFNCTEDEVIEMYQQENLPTDILLKWSKLFRYDFFQNLFPASDIVRTTVGKRTRFQNGKIFLTSVSKEYLYQRNYYLHFGTNRFRCNDQNRGYGTIQNTKNYPLQMDRQVQISKPDYKRIYSDILSKKYPEKKEECISLLEKQSLSNLDIIRLNDKIFGRDNANKEFNQKHRSYQKSDILQILDYQKKYKLNNSQLANHFNISRNTVTKWKKMFLT